MKTVWISGLAMLILGACALSPEQQAEREAAQRREAQNLQIFLAEQCNPNTAQLMRQYFTHHVDINDEQQRAFKLKYVEQLNDPTFQACYRLAWQNHIAQEQIQTMRNYYENRYWRHIYSPWFW